MRMHLRCLRCGEAFSMSQDAMAQVGYTKYSYCEKCLRLGLNKLRGDWQDEYLLERKIESYEEYSEIDSKVEEIILEWDSREKFFKKYPELEKYRK